MLFTENEREDLHNDAWCGGVVCDSEAFHYDADRAKGEVFKLWMDGENSSVFRNTHGCWSLCPTIN